MLLPGAWIGMLGGGQLGRMTTLAARKMGYRVVVLDPDTGCPAGQVADQQIVAPFDVPVALEQFADLAAVVTLEFENLPVATLQTLEERIVVQPGSRVLRICQNRLEEKTFLQQLGLLVAPFHHVHGLESYERPDDSLRFPAVLKTVTLGYDSKGQRQVQVAGDLEEAHASLGGVPCILEEYVRFEREISVIVARDVSGFATTYDPAENVHIRGILDTSMVPAPISTVVATRAQELAKRIAEAVDLVGVLAVELFLLPDGRLVVNELAPRPHNSGHWSIEACVTSQFEQQTRAVVGAPVGGTELLRPVACANLLGDLWNQGEPQWDRLLALPDVKLHLYGKDEAYPGRKMGHLTAFGATAEEARERVVSARALLRTG